MTLKEVSIITGRELVKRHVNGTWQIHFDRLEVKRGMFLMGNYGQGRRIKIAKKDYAEKLCFQRIVVKAMLPERQEFQLPQITA